MRQYSSSQSAVIIALAVCVLGLYGWRHYSCLHHRVQSKTPIPLNVVVQVSGKVHAPGTYVFAGPVSAGEVLSRAGGPCAGLRLDPRRRDLQVGHGRRLHIPGDGSGLARPCLRWMAAPSLIVLGVRLDVNRTSAVDLDLVPGVGRRLAERIVAHRKKLGGFRRLEELLAVKGIGQARLRTLRQYLTVRTREGPWLEPSDPNGATPLLGDVHGHRGSTADVTVNVNLPGMILDDTLADGKPQAHMPLFGGKERIENQG